MAEAFLTQRAIERYRECVADVPLPMIRQAIDCAAVRTAIEFGARFVRLGGGQRLVLEGDRVITVLPRDHLRGTLDPCRDPSFDDGGAA